MYLGAALSDIGGTSIKDGSWERTLEEVPQVLRLTAAVVSGKDMSVSIGLPSTLIEELEETRCNVFPNNECHQQATIFYWTQYKSRILHAALQREIVTEQWLKDTGNLRNAQHLFYVESRFNQ